MRDVRKVRIFSTPYPEEYETAPKLRPGRLRVPDKPPTEIQDRQRLPPFPFLAVSMPACNIFPPVFFQQYIFSWSCLGGAVPCRPVAPLGYLQRRGTVAWSTCLIDGPHQHHYSTTLWFPFMEDNGDEMCALCWAGVHGWYVVVLLHCPTYVRYFTHRHPKFKRSNPTTRPTVLPHGSPASCSSPLCVPSPRIFPSDSLAIG